MVKIAEDSQDRATFFVLFFMLSSSHFCTDGNAMKPSLDSIV